MITGDQSQVIAVLSSPATYGGVPVERIETHTAIVFLAGDRAWKLKRAIRYDYLDFSTPERRRAMCEAEIAVNRRTAPSLYLDLVPIVRRSDGTLARGGAGETVDWVIEMRRFEQDLLFDRLADRHRLDLADMAALGRAIAAFHAAAAVRRDQGGFAGMSWVVEGNAAGMEEFARDGFEPDSVRPFTTLERGLLDRQRDRLDRRRGDGRVRQCHGDLHLRNIVRLDGSPTLFDAIEFNDAIACVDVLYDLAFLLMDLWHRSLPRHANTVFNAYLGETFDADGLALLPLFLSCRAAIRAKTGLTTAMLQSGEAAAASTRAASEYLQLAHALAVPRAPHLVVIGGFSGTGKSTLARALAPAVGPVPGAIVLRSDEIRKQRFGVSPLQHLGAEAYGPESSAVVYRTLAERAADVLRAGHGAIVDAVFAREEDRTAIDAVAAAARVPLTAVWLEAPTVTLIDRVTGREPDASDADAEIVRAQVERGAGHVTWPRIDASAGAATVLADVTAMVARVQAAR